MTNGLEQINFGHWEKGRGKREEKNVLINTFTAL
jgi:hypothetical protein